MNALARIWSGPRWLLNAAIIVLVKTYRLLIRPLLPPSCRFEPSCSEYMILAVKKHGPLIGSLKGIRRVCRCHPWNAGGYDPP